MKYGITLSLTEKGGSKMKAAKLFVMLALTFCFVGNSRAQHFNFSNHSTLKQAIVEGKRLGPPSAGGSLLDAVDKRYFDVALLELKKSGVIEKSGPDALNFAIRKGDHEMVAFLLAAGVSPDVPVEGWYPTGAAAFSGDIESLCNMLDYGVDISKRNEHVGNLQMALTKMHIEAAVFLMAGGYKVNPDERSHLQYFGNKNGLQNLTMFLLDSKPNPRLVQQICAGTEVSPRSLPPDQ
jgi:ankyrin repeat protein